MLPDGGLDTWFKLLSSFGPEAFILKAASYCQRTQSSHKNPKLRYIKILQVGPIHSDANLSEGWR